MKPVSTSILGVMITTALFQGAPSASAETLVLQGSADAIEGFDDQHAGRAANFFTDSGSETGIYTVASDWAGDHNPNPTASWPAADGVVDWSYWDAGEHAPAQQGPQVVNAAGQVVYWDPANAEYVFYADDAAAVGTGHEKRYYLDGDQFASTLSIGNNGIPAGQTANRQYTVLSEYALQGVYDAGFDAGDLVSATFTFFIDDVTNMDLVSTDGRLPSAAFVNTYAGDGNLTDYDAVQTKFDLSNPGTADATVDLLYDDPALGLQRITDFMLARASILEGLPRMQFDFDVTAEVAALIGSQEAFAGLVLGSSDDGDFTLGSIDSVVLDPNTDEVLENYLPMLTLEFAVAELAGDYNGSGQVEQGDLDLVLQNWGVDATAGPPAGWVNDLPEGLIEQTELDGVLQNWGSSASPDFAAAAVPEPTASLIVLGCVCLTRRVNPNRWHTVARFVD